jgi:hypothetical protein
MSVFAALQQWWAMVSQAVKTWVESPLSRMNCPMFSTGLSSGHVAGRAMMLLVPGILRGCLENRFWGC